MPRPPMDALEFQQDVVYGQTTKHDTPDAPVVAHLDVKVQEDKGDLCLAAVLYTSKKRKRSKHEGVFFF